MTLTIGILGGSGQVGTELRRLVERQGLAFAAPRTAEVDITDETSLRRWVEDLRPHVVVNCAAYTAVDRAEDERERAFAVNAVGPELVARAAAVYGIPLIHLSTDYVFSGDQQTPYVEGDAIGPTSVYGQSKLEGERAVLRNAASAIVLRVAWVFSSTGRNFVKAILARAKEVGEVKVVGDQWGAPCSARSIAEAVLQLVSRVREGGSTLYHFSAQPYASWYDFASHIVSEAIGRGMLDPSVHVLPITTAEYPTKAKRPTNSRLNAERLLRECGIAPSSWHRELNLVLDEIHSESN